MSNDTPDTPGALPPDPARSDTPPIKWEREVLEKLVFATIKEQRANRRWSIFYKVALLLLVFFAIASYFEVNVFGGEGDVGRHTALIEIEGDIEAQGSGAAAVVIPALNKAFSDDGSVAVVLHINSPGGSPVQAGMIVDEIRRLREGYPEKPLYVVVDEICASGGYYIASAADRIYVNKASIIGSIGVLMDGFGFTGTMEKLGIERRLLTAGANKGFMDPFSPQSDKQKQHAQAMLNEIHQQFIETVRAGRGKRLQETPETFSGSFWTGARAIDMGLVDELGSVDSVARDVVKAEDIIDYTQHEGLPERVLKKFGAAVGSGAVKAAVAAGVPVIK
ncbi:S49 family peptidase [Pseudoduganella sp. SL102]|uniref:Peptidase n=1 Tax=Pseudoduganella albidiflava TaxID=321983 RepID=A0A411WTR3_9BURK|nr:MULTISPECIES: S49 family peptidase [Pseudoduganella]QBI00160.1 S49 family peptidase [Pseudoduganella albidiflava]WBS01809.1 S49 family peptidase [Pseudoduganella sp. SL102]GGY66291.1 peptidase [Pseudoduganella albidiflava]